MSESPRVLIFGGYGARQHELADTWSVDVTTRAIVQLEPAAPLPEPRQLHAGDWLWIAPHRRHRVEATDGGRGCLWLALFLPPNLCP